MATEVPLHVFVNCLRAAKPFDKEHSAFSQTKWMLEHWNFDDRSATYPAFEIVLEEQEEPL